MNQHYGLLMLLPLPSQALSFRLAFWRYNPPSLPEWLVISAYITTVLFVFMILVVPLHRYVDVAQWLIMLIGIAYVMTAMLQYFSDQARWKIVLRTLLGLVYIGMCFTLLLVGWVGITVLRAIG